MKHVILCICILAGALACSTGNEIGPDDVMVQMGPGGRTFYVSMSQGDDSNDGLSQTSPIKTLTRVNGILLGPGDQVLFRRGDVWFCDDESPPTPLVPWGRGLDGSPVVIGAYSTGPRPHIAGSGLTEAVRIQRTEYMRVQGLEITNDGERGYLGDRTAEGPRIRRGVYVMVEHIDYYPMGDYQRRLPNGMTSPDFGAMRGIELVDLEIHNVFGWSMHANGHGFNQQGGLDGAEWWNCAGIFIKSGSQNFNGGTGARAQMGLAIGRIVDPVIRDCYIHSLSATAIFADHSGGTWDHVHGDDGIDYIFTGLRVEGNVIANTASEGIGLSNGFWNYIIDGNGIYDLGYLASREYGNGWFMGVIYNGNNSVTQNNEIARMRWTGDSHAFDNDIGCYGVSLIQYNYVRDMTGSFLMNWGGWWAGEAATLVRYNISVNNGRWTTGPGYDTLLLRTNSNQYFYNNVFYNDKSVPISILGEHGDYAAFVNNIFWSNGPTVLNFSNWKHTGAHGLNAPYFDHNLYWKPGGAGTRADVVSTQSDFPSRIIEANGGVGFNDANAIYADPLFGQVAGSHPPNTQAGGAGGNENRDNPGYGSIIFGPPVRNIYEVASWFRITSASPAYQAGRPVTKKEVDDFLWGRIGDGVNMDIPRASAHSSISERGNPNIFNVNGGRDFFDNSIPNPESPTADNPSIGAHNP